MERSDLGDVLSPIIEDVTLALRPYGIDPRDCRACAALLRVLADSLDGCGNQKCPLSLLTEPAPGRLN